MKPCAAVDIGSNSVLLLIARAGDDGLEPLLERFAVTRLSEGVAATGTISPAAIRRTEAALADYARLIARYRAERVHCVGTQVFRQAANARQVIRAWQARFGWPVRVLTGREEARYTYLGALGSLTPAQRQQAVAVADIGGASTEVAIGRGTALSRLESLPLGGVVLKEQFRCGEQLDLAVQGKIREAVRRQLARSHIGERPDLLLAVGGTATTLAAVALGLQTYRFQALDGYRFTGTALAALFQQLNALSLEDRRALPGMEPGRADIILPATLILLELMRHFGLPELIVSARGVRFGILMADPDCAPGTIQEEKDDSA
ncbi:MAG: Ppx/GppA family phosphatase [Calditrichaeota bacterium]|nr:MAG: Ppx/GppA family phosphatase [Calditrichota bacterium]